MTQVKCIGCQDKISIYDEVCPNCGRDRKNDGNYYELKVAKPHNQVQIEEKNTKSKTVTTPMLIGVIVGVYIAIVVGFEFLNPNVGLKTNMICFAPLSIVLLIALLLGIAALLNPSVPSGGSTQSSFNPTMVCPHCQTKGLVKTKQVTQKKGISGAKATGAILTGGASVLATGLSRKENATEAHCINCNNTWYF